MALPEIKASDEVDCSPDSIKIVLSIRALISVANYNCVQSEGEEKRKDGNAMWHDRGVSSWTRRRKIRDRREKILFLARECPPPFTSEGLRAVNEQATGPSLPGSPLHRFVRSRLLSHCVCLSVYLSLLSGYRIFPHSLFLLFKEERRRELLLIYDKTDDDPVAQFPRRDLRNSSRRRETKGKKKRTLGNGQTRHYAIIWETFLLEIERFSSGGHKKIRCVSFFRMIAWWRGRDF